MSDNFSLIKFFKEYPDEESAVRYFERMRWGDEVVCPFCGKTHISEMKNHTPMKYRCRDCRKFFSVRTGTVLTESKLPLQKWLLAIYILTNTTKGVSSIQLAKYLDTTQKTAWFLGHRIRETWSQGSHKLYGVVEVDETYIGGKETNKDNSKKRKSGHGAVGKTPVVGAVSREGGVKAFVVQETNARTLETVIADNVDSTATLYTDQHGGYQKMGRMYDHHIVNHSVREFVKGAVYTNGIESFWAILKRGYYGIYHSWSVKHLQRYVNEFAIRANMKNVSQTQKIMITFARGLNTRLSYKELINAKKND